MEKFQKNTKAITNNLDRQKFSLRNLNIKNSKRLFMPNPTTEINMNFKNCSPNGWVSVPKVQQRFNKKLLTTANENPRALDRYLFKPIFSLQSQVTKKSIPTPIIPTTPNFINLISNISRTIFFTSVNVSRNYSRTIL